jgi:uncharacterized protein (TIGR00661 family)
LLPRRTLRIRSGVDARMKVFYGICGYGMGHAGRSIALIERLVELGHQVTTFTFTDAYRLLESSGYQPHRIEGLHFSERSDGGVAAIGSLCNLQRYLRRRSESLDLIRQLAFAERPDLFITDFEPLTALAAMSLGVPCVSVDNQHRFCAPLGSDFPLHLRIYSRMAGAFVRFWIKRPRQCIVAVFHRCADQREFERVNVLVRGRFAAIEPSEADHVLLYARGELGRRIARVASTVDARFHAYGFEGVMAPNIEYKRTSYEGFAADLAAARCVVCSAGQQLIGESRYFGKRLLVVPMPNQHEQEINARYVRREGIGDFSSISDLTEERIAESLRQSAPQRDNANGVDQIIHLLGIGYG